MIFTFGFAKIRTMSIFATDVLKQMFSNAKISILQTNVHLFQTL